jgi:hypothetical protein
MSSLLGTLFDVHPEVKELPVTFSQGGFSSSRNSTRGQTFIFLSLHKIQTIITSFQIFDNFETFRNLIFEISDF